MEPKRILVVDDEPDLVELLAYNLKKEGFAVTSSPDGEDALKKALEKDYDLVILDIMLPGIQGIELCRMLRNNPKTEGLPIIMVTAKGGETDRVLGLEIGADDYIAKPFSPREVIARIRAVLRRAAQRHPESKDKIKMGKLVIDRERCTVMKEGLPVSLSATEFRLLLYLVERRGKVFSRDRLLDAVWKGETYVEPRTVDVHIRRLRSRIEDDPSNPSYIKTRRGLGYYMDPDL